MTRKGTIARIIETLRAGDHATCATLLVGLLERDGISLEQQRGAASAIIARCDEIRMATAANSPLFEMSVDRLSLSVRAENCLLNANVHFIGELVQKSRSELLKTKNFGVKSLREIESELAALGLRLAENPKPKRPGPRRNRRQPR
jgi:DNA-directed RNA polymerase alpha subunit